MNFMKVRAIPLQPLPPPQPPGEAERERARHGHVPVRASEHMSKASALSSLKRKKERKKIGV